jgi:hypothetical protein
MGWNEEQKKAMTVKGYERTRVEWGGIGEGTQKREGNNLTGEAHWLVDINGKEADEFIRRAIEHGSFNRDLWNVSRIDLQITVPRSRHIEYAELPDLINGGELGEFQGRGKPKARAQASDTGHTLYIGSAKSSIMLRFYDKPLILGRKRINYDRYEIQLRDDYANPLVTRLFKQAPKYDRSVLMQFLKYRFSLLPDHLQTILSHKSSFTEAVSVNIPPTKTDKQESAKLKWLKSLKGSILALASKQGPEGIEARRVLLEALVVASTGDKLANWQDYVLVGTEANIIDPLQ